MKFVGRLVKQTAKLEYKRSLKKNLSFDFQKDTLDNLLKISKRTLLGKKYEFSTIISQTNSIPLFQEKVPILTYDEFYDVWLKHTISGKKIFLGLEKQIILRFHLERQEVRASRFQLRNK